MEAKFWKGEIMIRNNKATVAAVLVAALVTGICAPAKTGVSTAKETTTKTTEKSTAEIAKTSAAVRAAGKKKVEKRTGGKVKWIRKNLNRKKPMVALTFDDGPYTPVTKRILKVANKNGAKVTFFVVGNRVNTYKSMVKKAYKNGHQIASHTYNHANLAKLNKTQIYRELNKTNAVLKKVIGREVTAVRPPGGSISSLMRKVLNVPMIYWSVDTEDWRSRNASSVLSRCSKIKDGDIVLMHDLYPSTATAAETLIPRLKKKGYQLVTIDELFYYKKVKAKAGKVYFSVK